MNIIQLPVGNLQANCYIVEGEDNCCVLIDPGAEADKIIDTIDERQWKVLGILITHCHFDHIEAASELSLHYKADIYAHPIEGGKMFDPSQNLSEYFGQNKIKVEVNKYLEDQEEVNFGHRLHFIAIEVPGHTENSLCFYSKEGCVFTGDTLFNETIGRSDLYSGNAYDLKNNIRKKLLELPVQTYVYPGHGIKTTIGKEIKCNPYFI